MTAADFIRAGFRFTRRAGVLIAAGPRGQPALVEQLRAEVARRRSLVRDMRPTFVYGACELCADDIGVGRGGMCALCCAARQKVLVEMGALRAA